jgi:NadR type nicotinamide-nucleotide adenylyltransferase
VPVKKIVVIGPESTGKSTLSYQIAATLGAPCVPEYARKYLNELNRPYTEADLLTIAQGQLAEEEKLAQKANKLLVCDTDLYVIKVWSEHKYQRCHRMILDQIARRSYDLYLLTGIDMPWQDDPLREYPDHAMRHYFFHVYKDIVIHSGVPWALIEGTPAERLQRALAVIRTHFPDLD